MKDNHDHELPAEYQRLMRAVLACATRDYYYVHNRFFDGSSQNKAIGSARLRKCARDWFLADNASEPWCFSLHTICEELRMNENAIKSSVLRTEAARRESK